MIDYKLTGNRPAALARRHESNTKRGSQHDDSGIGLPGEGAGRHVAVVDKLDLHCFAADRANLLREPPFQIRGDLVQPAIAPSVDPHRLSIFYIRGDAAHDLVSQGSVRVCFPDRLGDQRCHSSGKLGCLPRTCQCLDVPRGQQP